MSLGPEAARNALKHGLAMGANGGEPGAGTEIKVNGKPVPTKGTVRLKQGDVLTVLSPDGGGYGAAT